MPPPDPRADRARAEIQAALGQIGFCLPGTITIHRTRCGKPRCACAADPPSLHGPYIQWTRTVNGKTVTRLLAPAHVAAPGLRTLVRQHPKAPRADRRTASPVPGGNSQSRRLGHDHPGHAAPPRTKLARVPTPPNTQNAGRPARLTGISPQHALAAGQHGSVVGPVKTP